jgi:hypothetical protein
VKISELIERLQDAERDIGDIDVVIQASGGIAGSVTSVNEANVGFDWTSGKFVIYPKDTMMVQTQKHKELRAARAVIAAAVMRSLTQGGDFKKEREFRNAVDTLKRLEEWKWGKKK